jgi:hypothetical protein
MIAYIILGAGLALAISGVTMWFAYKYEDKLMWTHIRGM